MIYTHATEIVSAVREDHELVAEQLRIMRELDGTIAIASGQRLQRVLRVLKDLAQFFERKLLPHFEEEERVMFPLFRDCLPRGSTLVYELEAEHEEMRKIYEQLCTELTWLRHARHRRPPVLADLQAICRRLEAMLTHHAEREELLLQRYLKSKEESCQMEGQL